MHKFFYKAIIMSKSKLYYIMIFLSILVNLQILIIYNIKKDANITDVEIE